MSYIIDFDQSNKADWPFDISATDGDPDSATFGDDIDFTGALVTVTIKDENNCQRLTATVGDGITLSSATTLSVLFTADQMGGLCEGSYKVGSTYYLNGETNPLFRGTLTVYDGIAEI